MTRIMTFREDSTCNVSNDPSSQGICPKKLNWCCLEWLNLNIATHLSYKEWKIDLKMWITSWLTAFAGLSCFVMCVIQHIKHNLHVQSLQDMCTYTVSWFLVFSILFQELSSITSRYLSLSTNYVFFVWIGLS